MKYFEADRIQWTYDFSCIRISLIWLYAVLLNVFKRYFKIVLKSSQNIVITLSNYKMFVLESKKPPLQPAFPKSEEQSTSCWADKVSSLFPYFAHRTPSRDAVTPNAQLLKQGEIKKKIKRESLVVSYLEPHCPWLIIGPTLFIKE